MRSNIGTPKIINFPFGTNGKLMVLGVPIFKHFRVLFHEKQLCHFHFCFPSRWGQLLKKKNLLSKEQILSFKSTPYFGKASSSSKANRKPSKCFSLAIGHWRLLTELGSHLEIPYKVQQVLHESWISSMTVNRTKHGFQWLQKCGKGYHSYVGKHGYSATGWITNLVLTLPFLLSSHSCSV